MVTFREYQIDIIDKSIPILLKHRFLYLAMEVRTGKTLTSLGIAKTLFQKNVLFVTKKKAINSIEQDYKLLSPKYKLIVINYESVHKVPELKWDMIICDEAHSLGAFPKPNNRAKKIKELIHKHNPYVILLSGTPTPESYSQLYHQVYGIPTNPFNKHKNFYKFSKEYVDVVEKKINGIHIRDYSRGRESILSALKDVTINFSQSQAGFKTSTNEQV